MSEMVHKRCLGFAMQRKVVILKDAKGMSFEDIAGEVVNLEGEHPSPQTVANYYYAFSSRLGRVRTNYANCGRQAWKFTPEIEKWLIDKLK